MIVIGEGPVFLKQEKRTTNNSLCRFSMLSGSQSSKMSIAGCRLGFPQPRSFFIRKAVIQNRPLQAKDADFKTCTKYSTKKERKI